MAGSSSKGSKVRGSTTTGTSKGGSVASTKGGTNSSTTATTTTTRARLKTGGNQAKGGGNYVSSHQGHGVFGQKSGYSRGGTHQGSSENGASRVVRVMEGGVDLTPLPLTLPSGPQLVSSDPQLESEPEDTPPEGGLDPSRSKQSLTSSAHGDGLSNEDLSAVEVTSEDGLMDDEPPPAPRRTMQFLTESATETLLSISGTCVATDFVRKAEIEAKNAAYEEMLAAKQSSDGFAERHAQTVNNAKKDETTLAAPAETAEAGCQAASWDIHDAISAVGERDDALLDAESLASSPKGSSSVKVTRAFSKSAGAEMRKTMAVAMAAPDFLLDVSEATVKSTFSDERVFSKNGPTSVGRCSPPPDMPRAERVLFRAEADKILASRRLASALAKMERCVQQNLFHAKQLRYRDRVSAVDVAAGELFGSESKYVPSPPTGAEAGVVDDAFLSTPHVGGDKSTTSCEDDAEATIATAGNDDHADAKKTHASSAAAAADEKSVADDARTSAQISEGGADGGTDGGTDASQKDPTAAGKTNREEREEQGATTTNGCTSGVVQQQQQTTTTNASLEELWAWNAPMTKGRAVTSMSWNGANGDVLAVGYSSTAETKSGLVLLWSLRNPVFPERVLRLATGCTALDFSKLTPHLLAVGTRDGAVLVYDVRRDVLDEPVLDSEHCAGKHMDPVWQVQWVDKGAERGETLVSVSTDGRVVEWSTKKGLEETTLMALKRVGNAEGVISRQASGLCFDFPMDDAAVYFAGTEDGPVHRCSCSYNEQYLETYHGHAGPVYKIKCSPFFPAAFLSCSADWTVKLWHHKHSTPLLTFHSVDLAHVVHDVAWSPSSETVFASVAGDGRIELWDLDQSSLDPVVRHFAQRRPDFADLTDLPPPPPNGSDADDDSFLVVGDSSKPDPAAPQKKRPDDDAKIKSGHSGGSELARPSKTGKKKPESEPPPVPLSPDPGLADDALADDADVVDLPPPGATAVLFAKSAPVLVVGDSLGAVTCYRIKGLPQPDATQLDKLKSAMFPDAKA